MVKERFLTRQNVFVSILVLVLRSLALFTTVEKLALLLLQGLNERECQISRVYFPPMNITSLQITIYRKK